MPTFRNGLLRAWIVEESLRTKFVPNASPTPVWPRWSLRTLGRICAWKGWEVNTRGISVHLTYTCGQPYDFQSISLPFRLWPLGPCSLLLPSCAKSSSTSPTLFGKDFHAISNAAVEGRFSLRVTRNLAHRARRRAPRSHGAAHGPARSRRCHRERACAAPCDSRSGDPPVLAG